MELQFWRNPCDWEDFTVPAGAAFHEQHTCCEPAPCREVGTSLTFPHDRVIEGTQISQFLQDMKDGFSLSMELAHQHLPIAQGIDEPTLMPVTCLMEAFPGIFWELKQFLVLNVVLETQNDANVPETTWILLSVCEEVALLMSPENLGQSTD